MTIREFQLKLDKQVKDLKTFTDPLRIAAFSVTDEIATRIFSNGKNSDGSNIGKYSTKPLYINPDVLKEINVPGNIGVPRGKNGDTKFKSGKKKGEKHKTKYFAQGYKEFRGKLGRENSFVNLRLSGEERMDFANGVGEGSPAIPRKESDFEYQIRFDKLINQKKREGQEDKYGQIFTPSETEKELFFDTIQFEFNKRLAAQK